MSAKRSAIEGGGKKGGTIFPRFDLDTAVVSAKRLVSKSHTGPIAKDVYVSGVLQVTGPRADMKSSALKQFGFLLGNTKNGFEASALAKEVALGGDEAASGLKKAALSPKIFNKMFEPFRGDTVSKTKLKQRAATLKVHPDMLDSCVKIYLDSLGMAGLVAIHGDDVTHVPEAMATPLGSGDVDEESGQGGDAHGDTQVDRTKGGGAADEGDASRDKIIGDPKKISTRASRALINVNISLDSSLDTEKLEKQLALLRKFGAI